MSHAYKHMRHDARGHMCIYLHACCEYLLCKNSACTCLRMFVYICTCFLLHRMLMRTFCCMLTDACMHHLSLSPYPPMKTKQGMENGVGVVESGESPPTLHPAQYNHSAIHPYYLHAYDYSVCIRAYEYVYLRRYAIYLYVCVYVRICDAYVRICK
jgi:hypothetical protein